MLASARLLGAFLRSGEGGSRPVVGDEIRQAVDALGGYCYQIYASALAWLDLPPGAELYLEVAEDYAVAASDSLRATQVRRQAGTVSLAAEPVREAIASFVRLAGLNPGRSVRLTYLTTASITRERNVAHRTGDVPGLRRWTEAASAADVADVRRALEHLDLGAEVRRYIDERDDERLRTELLQRIEWRCGEADQAALDFQLRERLAGICLERFDVPPTEGEQLTPYVLQDILRTCTRKGLRTRTYEDLQALLRGATAITMDRSVHNAIMVAVGNFVAAAANGPGGSQTWCAEAEVPLPVLLVPRRNLAAKVDEALAKSRAAVIHGGTGMGKTSVARSAARSVGGQWNLLELRGRSPGDAGERLLAYARRPSDTCCGVIADDMPDVHVPGEVPGFARAMRMLADRGEYAVITSDRAPTSRGRQLLGIVVSSVIAVPPLTGEELISLVEAAGGHTGWATPLQIASRGGHPQLANALVIGLQSRGWPEGERNGFALSGADELAEESEAARARLIAAVPDASSRLMLHRMSIVAGHFPRQTALALGTVPKAVASAGDCFQTLVGPWIDRVAADRFRVSPLLAGSGNEMLPVQEVLSVHRTIADSLVDGGRVLADQIDNIFFHAMAASSPGPLAAMASLIVRSDDHVLRRLQPHALRVAVAGTERPIADWDVGISVTLRLAQTLILAARGFGNPAVLSARALVREAGGLRGKAGTGMEQAAFVKLLFTPGMSGAMPEWPDILGRLLSTAGSFTSPGASPSMADLPRDIGSVLFSFAVSGLRSVAQLADAFGRLSTLDDPIRSSILGRPVAGAPATLIALSPWLKERKDGRGGAAAAIAHYDRMAGQAAEWGQRDWAVALNVAVAELTHAELQDFEGAISHVRRSREALGDDRWFGRAEQKVRFAQEDDRATVSLVEALRGRFPENDVEAAYMVREGAISASRLGEHGRSAAWFGEASSRASDVDQSTMQALAVGLAADSAAERWRSGDRCSGLAGMAAALEALVNILPDADIQSGYVHRILRHSLLWFAHAAGMRGVEVDGSPPALPPGACSRPEPAPSILSVPLEDMDVGWYFLKQIAIAAGCAEAVPEPGARLAGDPLIDMEAALAMKRLEKPIAEADAALFMTLLPDAFDAAAVAAEAMKGEAAGERHVWRRGRLPRADPADKAGLRLVEDAILAFRVSAAASGRDHAADAVRETLAASTAFDVVEAFGSLFPDGEIPPLGARRPEECARLLARGDLSPEELLECCIRLAVQLERSAFHRAVTGTFVRWAKREWLRIATSSRFSLSAPRSSAPAIAQAARADDEDLRALAALLLAGMHGTAMTLPETMAEWVRTTARS